MKEISKEEFEQALVDVRKAYRLLFLYQKRILDLVNFIGKQFDKLEFQGGYPKFSNPTNYKNLDKWSWDWLNMYFYEFHFTSKGKNEKIDFSILLQSDSGSFEENLEVNDRPLIEKYKSVEESKSKLIFIVCNNKDLWNLEDIEKHTNVNSYKSELEFYVKKHLDKGSEKGIFISKSYDLSDFLNEEMTNEKLKNFINFCNGKGLDTSKILKNKKGTLF